jgi:signal transduction histidine kinase
MNNCDMLMRLINDILAISSVDTSGIHIEPVEVDFAKSFNVISESMKERVQNPNVEFIKDNPYSSFITVIDDARIQQVITNFVTNAVKYTHQGHIKVGYRYEDGHLYVYCEDTGAGIPKEHQAKIFERFVKLNDFVQGTGLGLSICQAIAMACHGEVGVESEGEGHGSTFWLRIPCEEVKSEK